MTLEKPRISRLTAIITQLQSQSILTAKTIAEKHHVSIRTVYRDIKTLEQSGIPIITVEGKGYSLMKGYKLPPVMFTEEEALALITSEKIILKNKDRSLTEYYQNAILKIKSVLRTSDQSKAEILSQRIQVRNNSNEEKTSHYLIQIQSYIANYKAVEIEYISLSQHPSVRVIEPFAIFTTHDNWLLIAFCRLKNDFRSFRVDCIQKIRPLTENFKPHKITLKQYFESCRKKWSTTPDIPLSNAGHTFASNQKIIDMQKVHIKPFKLIGIAVKTSNENNQALKDISAMWDRFLKQNLIEKIPNKINSKIYSLYTDYSGDHTKPYLAILACQVKNFDEIPEGMITKEISGGNYIKTTAKGNLMNGLIAKKWAEIWEMDLERAYTADFEVFGDKAQDPTNAEIEFFIAIKTNN